MPVQNLRVKYCANCASAFMPTSGAQRYCSKGCQILFCSDVAAGGCREWTGYLDKDGYGQISMGWPARRTVHVHRVSFECFTGGIPDDMLVCHSCDNTKCVEPKHLFLGTSAENTADSVKKQRRVRGERVNTAKLSADGVKAIWSDERPYQQIADEHGISYGYVYELKTRTHRWKHLRQEIG